MIKATIVFGGRGYTPISIAGFSVHTAGHQGRSLIR